MKRLLLLLLLLFPIYSFAQFYDSHNYYLYIPLGETAQSSGIVYYAHFDRNSCSYCEQITKSILKSKYEGEVLDEYAINKQHTYKYDSKTSTYKYEVYRAPKTKMRTMPPFVDMFGNVLTVPDGFFYVAFSIDRTEMIKWNTTENSDVPRNKRHYKLVDINELIPASNGEMYDFLL